MNDEIESVSKAEQLQFSESLETVEKSNKLAEGRSKISALLADFERGNLVTGKTADEYRKAAENEENAEGLEGFYQWMEKQWVRANEQLDGMKIRIDEGVRKKIMSSGDYNFLMENLILKEGTDFIGQCDKIDEVLTEKIQRMEKDRKRYDKITNHPLAEGQKHLKTGENSRFELPDEKQFLKWTVPERRKFLEAAEKQIPEAEKYAEKSEKSGEKLLEKKYTKLLSTAREKKWIGKATEKKYLEDFKKQSGAEKARWVREMENGEQMDRYKKLWSKIRENLSGDALKEMEKKRETMGYSKLMEAFGIVLEKEKSSLDSDYEKKLEKAYGQGIVSRKTHKAFRENMKRQTLEGKKDYLKKFDEQMKKYTVLRVKISRINDKETRQSLESMYESEEAGFSEISARYQRVAARFEDGKSMEKFNDKNLIEVSDIKVRKAIVKSGEKMGDNEKKGMLKRLTGYFESQQSEKIDASSFQKNLRQARERLGGGKKNKSDKKLSLDETKNTGKTFVKKTISNEDGKLAKVSKVFLDDESAVRSMVNETPMSKGRDRLTLLISSEDGKAVRLKMHEIRAAIKYLDEDLKQEV